MGPNDPEYEPEGIPNDMLWEEMEKVPDDGMYPPIGQDENETDNILEE